MSDYEIVREHLKRPCVGCMQACEGVRSTCKVKAVLDALERIAGRES